MTALPALCRNLEGHTHQPTGYIEWFDWAEKMSKTYKQRRCKGCGRFVIWEPKP